MCSFLFNFRYTAASRDSRARRLLSLLLCILCMALLMVLIQQGTPTPTTLHTYTAHAAPSRDHRTRRRRAAAGKFPPARKAGAPVSCWLGILLFGGFPGYELFAHGAYHSRVEQRVVLSQTLSVGGLWTVACIKTTTGWTSKS